METNTQIEQFKNAKDGRVRSGRKKRLYTPTEQRIVSLLLEHGGTFKKSKRQISEQTNCCKGSINTAIKSLCNKEILKVKYQQDEFGSCQANIYSLRDNVTQEDLDEIVVTNPYVLPVVEVSEES